MKNNYFFRSIHAMRGLASFAVLISHSLTLYPFFEFRAAAAGVDIFFVISGIVMCLAIEEDTSKLDFIKKRIIRVVPLYWIATGLSVAYIYARYPHMSHSWDWIIRSFLFLPQQPGVDMPVLYTGWSLNYEMFFYLILFLSLFIFKNSPIAAACIVAMIASFSAVGDLISYNYFFKQIFIEFSLGILIGYFLKFGGRVEKNLGIFLIFLALVIFFIHNKFASSGFLAWGVPSAMLILGAISFENSELFKRNFVKIFGDASYSLYLVHPLVIWGIEWYVLPEHRGILQVAIAIAISIFISIIFYKLVEKPLMRFLSKNL
ncbi:acyltransferase family protein [Delftia acidovorans]|uniref:acyltransferase family protein n=1 Tax=Delftia acidovorans TaxID=80866 RepID=UPI0018E70926|nr:acyltransferase [Delftia acidovorans]